MGRVIFELDTKKEASEVEDHVLCGDMSACLWELRKVFREKARYEPNQKTTWSEAYEIFCNTTGEFRLPNG